MFDKTTLEHQRDNRDLLDLVARAQAGDQDALELVVERCRSVIEATVGGLYTSRPTGYDFDDLEQQAFVYVLELIRSVDLENVTDFEGLIVVHIRQKLKRLITCNRTITLPTTLYEYAGALHQAQAAGVPLTPENIASYAPRMSADTVRAIMHAQHVKSLDAPRFQDNDQERYSSLAADDVLRPTEVAALHNIAHEQLYEQLCAVRAQIDDDYWHVAEAYLQCGSFDEIAAQLGLTRNQVRWRWRRALLALREGMAAYRLESPQLPGLRRDHRRWHVVSGGAFIGTFPTEPQARAARRAFDAAKAAA